MKTGWHRIDNETYHASAGISSSQIKLLSDCPYKFHNRTEIKQTDAMKIGSRVHGVLLGDAPEMVAMPKLDRRTKAGKEEYAKFMAENAYSDICSQDDIDRVNAIADSVKSHTDALYLLGSRSPVYELAGYYNRDVYGLCKIKPDIRRDNMIVDVKTIGTSASPESFTRQLINLKYHLSAAYYLDIASAIDGNCDYTKFAWIVVETKPPYTCAVYYASDEMIERGRELYVSALDKLHECKNKDEWPAYETQTLHLPSWAL